MIFTEKSTNIEAKYLQNGGLGSKNASNMVPNGALGGAWSTAPKKAPKSELMVRTFANFGSTLGGPKWTKK